MKTPILIALALVAAFGPSVDNWLTFVGIVIIGVINSWNDHRTQKTLGVIKLEVNSRLTEALDRISELEAQVLLATGHRAKEPKK